MALGVEERRDDEGRGGEAPGRGLRPQPRAGGGDEAQEPQDRALGGALEDVDPDREEALRDLVRLRDEGGGGMQLKGPQRRPQRRLGRRLEEVTVGYKCH